MAVCPTCFKTQYQLPHRAVISDVIVVVPVPGALGIGVQFDKPMDQTVMPDALTLEVEIDSVTYPCTPTSWQSSTQLNCSTTASSPVTDAYIRQLKIHNNLRSLPGTLCRKQPWLQWYP